MDYSKPRCSEDSFVLPLNTTSVPRERHQEGRKPIGKNKTESFVVKCFPLGYRCLSSVIGRTPVIWYNINYAARSPNNIFIGNRKWSSLYQRLFSKISCANWTRCWLNIISLTLFLNADNSKQCFISLLKKITMLLFPKHSCYGQKKSEENSSSSLGAYH